MPQTSSFAAGAQSHWSGDWLHITRSIVQGSGIGPSAYVVYSADLKSLSEYLNMPMIYPTRPLV